MEEAREIIEKALDKCLSKSYTDWNKIKTEIRIHSTTLSGRKRENPYDSSDNHGGLDINKMIGVR